MYMDMEGVHRARGGAVYNSRHESSGLLEVYMAWLLVFYINLAADGAYIAKEV